jgi:NAD-dependent DNA ligase
VGKRRELWRYIYGLGIPQIGAVSSQEAARRFGGLRALATADGQGDAISRALADYFALARNQSIVDRLIAAG